MAKTKLVHFADDGTEFETYEAAVLHDKKIENKKEKAYQDYLRTWNGNELLKIYNLTDYDKWKVYGEDPNCDLGGYHHEPFLGTFEGKLETVIKHAVGLDNFWQWGGGGRIIKEEKVVKLD